jgi:hypothetical protein
MTDGATSERRRHKIQERITMGFLPGSLSAEEPTWIPTPYARGTGARYVPLLLWPLQKNLWVALGCVRMTEGR